MSQTDAVVLPASPSALAAALPQSCTPRDALSQFDLVLEFQDSDIRKYTGAEDFTLYALPSYARTALEYARAAIGRLSSLQRTPSINSVVSCCIEYGCRCIASDQSIEALLYLRQALDSLPVEDVGDLEAVASWFRKFDISIPNALGGRNNKWSVRIPERVRSGIMQVGGDLGLSGSELSVLSIMYTLEVQGDSVVRPGHRKLFSESLRTFARAVEMRTRIGKVMMEFLVPRPVAGCSELPGTGIETDQGGQE